MVVSFRDAVSGAIANSLCTVLAVGDNVYRLFDWGLDPQGRGNVAAGVRRLLCNIDPDNDTTPAPTPFIGGQCNGDVYGVVIQVTGSQPSIGTRFFRGPIGGIRFGGPAGNRVEIFSRERLGSLQVWPSVQAAINGITGPPAFPNDTSKPLSWQWSGYSRDAETHDASIEAVVNRSSTNDECGDPPPEYPEPEPVVGPTINITYNIDESTQITVPLTAVFAPFFIKATGVFSFPIRVDVGGITFSGTFDVSPTININIYPDGSGGGNGGTTDEPDDDIPPIDIPDEDETPDFESRIIGVFIRSSIDTNTVRASGIPAGENLPEIWAPRLANCKFLIRSRATTGWTKDIDVKNANQYIPCPHPGGAVDVRVFPQQGVTVAVEPHRAAPLLPDLPPAED